MCGNECEGLVAVSQKLVQRVQVTDLILGDKNEIGLVDNYLSCMKYVLISSLTLTSYKSADLKT